MRMYFGLRTRCLWNEIAEILLLEFIVSTQMPKQSAKFSCLPAGVPPPNHYILSIVKRVFYPKYNPSRANYDAFRTPDGGYGGLLSVVFHNDDHAVVFYDTIET